MVIPSAPLYLTSEAVSDGQPRQLEQRRLHLGAQLPRVMQLLFIAVGSGLRLRRGRMGEDLFDKIVKVLVTTLVHTRIKPSTHENRNHNFMTMN